VHRVREEVSVDEDRVGWAEGRVGLEEEGGGDLWASWGGSMLVVLWCGLW
jgi:hypothetical protein